MMQWTVLSLATRGTNMSIIINNNKNKGDDCLSQSEEVEMEKSVSQIALTEDQLLASSQEDMVADPPSIPVVPSADDKELDMDDDKEDGIRVIINPVEKPRTSDRVTLTRGQRKMLKTLRDSGLSRPEALSKILGKEVGAPANPKRGRKELDSSTTLEEVPKLKRIKQQIDPRERVGQTSKNGSSTGRHSQQTRQASRSYSEMASRRKVGITPKDYPTTQLSTSQLDVLQEALLQRVEHQRNASIKPKFYNLLYKSGYMVLVCKDQETADWVKETTPSLSPLEDVELVAMDEDKIQRPEPLRAFFPQSEKYSDDRIKALIESQNDLSTTSWRILQRSTLNNIHVEWIFTVDVPTMQALTKMKFILNYRFGEIQLRKIKNSTPRSNKSKSSERPSQEKSEEAINKPLQPNTTIKASLLTSKGSSNPIPGPSGVNQLMPNKDKVVDHRASSEAKQTGLGGKQVAKKQRSKPNPNTFPDDPQHPTKDGNRPDKGGPSNNE